MSRRGSSVAVVSCVLLASASAHAADLDLAWSAPKECPSADSVRAATTRMTSKARGADPKATPLEAEARVEHADRWRVTLRTKRGSVTGERRIEASTCEALADATAVVLALALVAPGDAPEAVPAVPAAAAAPAEAPPASAPRAEPTTDERPRASEPSAAPPAREAPSPGSDRLMAEHDLAVGAALAGDAATLPAPTMGGAAAIAWTPGRLRLEAGGAFYAGQSRTTDQSPAGADLRLLVAGARGCWAVVRSVVEIAPCAGSDLNVLTAKGFGAPENYDTSAAWASGSAGALLRVPVASWLALRGQADFVVPFARPRFVVEGEGAIHRPAPSGLRGALGAELLFL
jgi:hypothetical protein